MNCMMEKLLEKLQGYQERFDNEVQFKTVEGTDLHNAALKTNDLLVQWINSFIKEKTELKKLYREHDKLIHKLRIYYSGKAAPEIYEEKPLNDRILRGEVDQYIKSDDDYLNLKERIDVQENIVELCQMAVEALKSRTFLIKDAIRFLEFINGK